MPSESAINFVYAFGTPHRLCICLPEASKKSLLDASESGLTWSWGDGDLTQYPAGAWASVRTDWIADFAAEASGSPLAGTKWQRVDNRLPALIYRWEGAGVTIVATAVAVDGADVLRLEASNTGDSVTQAGVYGMTRKLCVNRRWIERDSPYNALLGHQDAPPDRMLFLAVGASPGPLRGFRSIDVVWELGPGERQTAYIVRPHFARFDDIDQWLARDWEAEIAGGLDAWRRQLARAPRFKLPDPLVEDAFYAGLADIFVMRELLPDGHVAGTAGTQVYRAANSGEPCFQSHVLNRTGYFAEARDGIEFVTGPQEPDGNWEDARRWGHHMWGTSGWKARAVWDHYLFTHDRPFLAEMFEHMLANCRWSQRQREGTKLLDADGRRPWTWGLMPRGLGDCGLMDENGDLFGVFYPHNIWHYFGLEIATWTAQELGRSDVLDELRSYAGDLRNCLLASLEIGAIAEPDGSRWIPGLGCQTAGSRWGAANAIAPCGLLAPHDPLAEGTMRRLTRDISEGGLPKNLGWMKDGLWVAIAVDEIAYAHIARGEEDQAAAYLLAALNHATPLFSWCEERLPQPGTKTVSGDLQHAWTPIAVSRLVREALLMEDGARLHIARVTPREWLAPGKEISVAGAPTFWGTIDYRLRRESADALSFELQTSSDEPLPVELVLHVRVPDERTVAIAGLDGAEARVEGQTVVITPRAGAVSLALRM